MRLRAILFATVALGGAAAGAYMLADAATVYVEEVTQAQLSEALTAAAEDWVDLGTDGLMVIVAGEAPDEAGRIHALGIVRQLVAPARVSDRTSVRTANPVALPAFALELLRNEAEVSLIGLVPEPSGRAAIHAGLDRAGLASGVTDMLDSASQPAPPGWDASLAYALRVLAQLPRAKISVSPGRVTVIATADTDTGRRLLEARLEAERPAEVQISLDISAPRPVITPFAVDYIYADGVGHFTNCAAETVADVVEIGVAARQVGLSGEPDCKVGLGAPSPEWAEAVRHGLAALGEMGSGRFAIRDIEAVLTGPADIDPERLSAIGARLDAELPDVFSLSTVKPPRMETLADGQRIYAPRFNAALAEDGSLRLEGALQNATSRDAVESYAAALFGHDRVTNATVIDPDLPEGWPGRVLVGIAALAELTQGRLEVTPDQVSVSGAGSEPSVNATVAALLTAKVGDGAAVDVHYKAQPIPAPAAGGDPEAFSPIARGGAGSATADPAAVAACAEEIAAILETSSIEFSTGSSEIEAESRGIILAIADVLRACPGASFEIAGYTDSQGRAEVNQRLSAERAEAVAEELRAAELPGLELTATGYGAADPIADNATAEGRARNRRIAFIAAAPATDPDQTEPATENAGDDEDSDGSQ